MEDGARTTQEQLSTNPGMDGARTTQEQLSTNPWMDGARTTQEQLSTNPGMEHYRRSNGLKSAVATFSLLRCWRGINNNTMLQISPCYSSFFLSLRAHSSAGSRFKRWESQYLKR